MTTTFNEKWIERPIGEISEELESWLEEETTEGLLRIGEAIYQVTIEANERMIYFMDVTDQEEAFDKFHQSKTVLAMLYLDNYDEVMQGIDDQVRGRMMSIVTKTLNEWADYYGVYLRRTSVDRFIAVMHAYALKEMEESRFEIIDHIREETAKEKIAITLSIGVGTDEDDLRELGKIAQSSLDLALGRGGDQVAIKRKNGRVRFMVGSRMRWKNEHELERGSFPMHYVTL